MIDNQRIELQRKLNLLNQKEQQQCYEMKQKISEKQHEFECQQRLLNERKIQVQQEKMQVQQEQMNVQQLKLKFGKEQELMKEQHLHKQRQMEQNKHDMEQQYKKQIKQLKEQYAKRINASKIPQAQQEQKVQYEEKHEYNAGMKNEQQFQQADNSAKQPQIFQPYHQKHPNINNSPKMQPYLQQDIPYPNLKPPYIEYQQLQHNIYDPQRKPPYLEQKQQPHIIQPPVPENNYQPHAYLRDLQQSPPQFNAQLQQPVQQHYSPMMPPLLEPKIPVHIKYSPYNQPYGMQQQQMHNYPYGMQQPQQFQPPHFHTPPLTIRFRDGDNIDTFFRKIDEYKTYYRKNEKELFLQIMMGKISLVIGGKKV